MGTWPGLGIIWLYALLSCNQNKVYLDQANKIAQFLLGHTRLPQDKIPYWDFDAPEIPNALRDASAAAVIVSALLELCSFTTGSTKDKYFSSAQSILNTLIQPLYRTKNSEAYNFLLKHSVGHMPTKSEVDVPLTYADYYFLEAASRYLLLVTQHQLASFTLINADTDQPIQTLLEGTTINLATMPTRNLNIRANTNPITVGSVVFNLTGTQNKTTTENGKPYALFSKSGNDYYNWSPAVGTYNVKATPYSGCNANGTSGKALTVNFNVVDKPVVAIASVPEKQDLAVLKENKPGLHLVAFPNPNAGNSATILIQNLQQQQNLKLLVLDATGSLIKAQILVAGSRGTSQATLIFDHQLKPGLYFVQVQTAVGAAHTKLLVK